MALTLHSLLVIVISDARWYNDLVRSLYLIYAVARDAPHGRLCHSLRDGI